MSDANNPVSSPFLSPIVPNYTTNIVNSAIIQCPDSVQPKNDKKVDLQKYKNISIKCKHRTCPPSSYLKTFELVPDNALPINDEITVIWTGNDPKPPTSLTVVEAGSPNIVIPGPPFKIPLNNAAISAIFPDSYRKISANSAVAFGKELLDTIFTYNKKRILKIGGLPDGPMDIIIYNPDKWELVVKFPLPGRYEKKSGTKWEGTFKDGKSKTFEASKTIGSKSITTTTKDYNDRKTGDPSKNVEITKQNKNSEVTNNTTTSVSTSKNSTIWTTITASPEKKISPNNIISLSKNGSPLTISGLGIIHFIAQVIKWIENISKVLKDIPKAGAYVEYHFSAMEGEFSLGWLWTEYKPDHQAFMQVIGKFDITLLDIGFEMGIGISGFSVKFQAFASIIGLLKVTASFERTKPWKPDSSGGAINETINPTDGPINASIAGSIIGSVGARFEAGYFVKIEVKVSTGIKLTGTLTAFDGKDPFIISAKLSFTGIKATLETSVGFADVNGTARTWDPERNLNNATGTSGYGGSTSGTGTSDPKKEWVFIDECEIGYWKWPDAFKKYEPKSEMTDNDIKRSITEMLNGRYLNSGFWNGKKIIVKKYLTGEENDPNKLINIFKWGYLGQDAVKDADDAEIVEMIFRKMSDKPFFDKTSKKVELFLSEIRKDLVPLMIERQDHWLEANYIEMSDLNVYLKSQAFGSRLNNNIDSSKEFLATNQV
jgi:hypothetical protein